MRIVLEVPSVTEFSVTRVPPRANMPRSRLGSRGALVVGLPQVALAW